MSNLVKLQSVFEELFDDDAGTISEATSMDTLEDWDSMAHVDLIGLIEEKFEVEIPLEQAIEMRSVESILKFLDS